MRRGVYPASVAAHVTGHRASHPRMRNPAGMPVRGPALLVRGGALGAACLIVSTLGHMAGGHASTLGAFLIAIPVAWALGCAVAERRHSAAPLIIFAALTQILLHALLSVGGHGSHALPTALSNAPATLARPPALWPSLTGLAGHAAAAVIIGWTARGLDDLLHRLQTALSFVNRLWPSAVVLAVPEPVRRSFPADMLHEVQHPHASAIARRGPPRCCEVSIA